MYAVRYADHHIPQANVIRLTRPSTTESHEQTQIHGGKGALHIHGDRCSLAHALSLMRQEPDHHIVAAHLPKDVSILVSLFAWQSSMFFVKHIPRCALFHLQHAYQCYYPFPGRSAATGLGIPHE
jgi:hypothetical protein